MKTTERIEYAIRNIETKEITALFTDEQTTINYAGRINKALNEEVVEVVKIVTTIETVAI